MKHTDISEKIDDLFPEKKVEVNHNSSRIGDIAEHYAITWLWDQGYEVFKNTGCSGPIDIIAVKDGEIKLLDVKTEKKNGSTGHSRTYEQKQFGVNHLMFNAKTRKFRFVNHK